MAEIDNKYHDLLLDILHRGRKYEDPNRKGVKRLQIPSYTFEYDMTKGFPAITTKKLAWKSVVGELLWFLRGDTNIKYLIDNNINIWNKDAYNYYLKKFNDKYPKSPQNAHDLECFISLIGNENTPQQWMSPYKFGDCGRIYGAQWRKWCGNKEIQGSSTAYIDQISNLIKNLKEKPLATDHIVTAWNPAEKDQMALPPCHNMFQINVWELTARERFDESELRMLPYYSEEDLHILANEDDYPKYGFELVWNQRSVDTFLGLPFNIASYGLLAHIIGKLTNMVPMSLKGTLNNVHIYDNALKGVEEQLSRNTDTYDNCKLRIKTATNRSIEKFQEDVISLDKMLNEFEINQFVLEGYKSYPSIKVEMLERD